MSLFPLTSPVSILKFRTDITQGVEEGQVRWNPDEGTLDVGLPGGTSVMQVGQEIIFRAKNTSGGTLTNGTPVFISGASGDIVEINASDASSQDNCRRTIAITTEDIDNNQLGYVTILGRVRDVNTAAFNDGDIVYVAAGGGLTNVIPVPTNAVVRVGIVTRSHATEGVIGAIFDVKSLKELLVDTGDLTIKTDTEKTIVLDQPVWEDIQFPVSSGKVGVANFPSWETFTTNTSAYAFDVGEYIDLGSNEPPHSYQEGTDGSFHAHIVIKTAQSSGASQYVKIQLDIAFGPVGSVISEGTIYGEIEIPDGTSALHHFIFPMSSQLDFSSMTIGSQIKSRVTRIAATSGTEYASSVFILQVGCHVKNDTIGSRTVAAK